MFQQKGDLFMKQSLKLLVLVPIFALVACENLGKEADAETIAKYQAGMATVQSPANITFSVKMSGKTGQNHEAIVSEYKMKKAENGDVYYYSYSKQGKDEGKAEVYRVQNEKYEEVTYIKSLSEGKEAVLVYVKKDNDDYSTQTSTYVLSAGIAPAMFYEMLADPEEAADLMNADADGVEYKYYSNGEKNLSVKATVKEMQPDEDEEEYAKSGSMTITYNDYLLSSFSASSKSNLGNNSTASGKASYGKVSISLPSGWEKAIVKVVA